MASPYISLIHICISYIIYKPYMYDESYIFATIYDPLTFTFNGSIVQ